MNTKIRMSEDALLRSRNAEEIETIYKQLTFLRASLQRMKYAKES